jgi:hypothetical protein
MVPERLNVWENIAFMPLGKVVNPGVDGLPVLAKEIQVEPGRAAAQAGFAVMSWVALPELLTVLMAELSIGVESALIVKKQPLARTAKAKVANFFIIWSLQGLEIQATDSTTTYIAGMRPSINLQILRNLPSNGEIQERKLVHLGGKAFPAQLGGFLLRVDEILRVRALEIFNLATSHKVPDTGSDLVDDVVVVCYE